MKCAAFLHVCLLLAAGGLAAVSRAENPAPVRERLVFDFGWKFHFGDAADPAKDFGYGTGNDLQKVGGYGDGTDPTKAASVTGMGSLKFDDADWQAVSLPHDWAVALPFDPQGGKSQGFKPLGRLFPATSIGWYRRVFPVPAGDLGRRIVVEFDGVYRDAQVWLNGCLLGRNESGYDGFRFDLTDYLNYGTDNVLVVRVDATQSEGWFYEGAGIYRHVWLVKTGPLHVAPDGVQVLTDIHDETAGVTANVGLTNDSDSAATCRMESVIIDAAGHEVVRGISAPFALAPRQETDQTQELSVTAPRLWSLESPVLYKLVTTLRRGDAVADVVETTFGFRTIRFDPDRGFFLNGRHVEIKGVCCHQDHAGVGVALPDRLQEFRLERLREIGANAYRSSHNAPTSELLDDCDRLGILVMDENREPGSTPAALDRLARLIRRDRNHPSVIMWSLANEEKYIQATGIGARIGETMKQLAHRLDPSRPVTFAMNGAHGQGFSTVADVEGFNYNEARIDAYHQMHPSQSMIGTETGSAIATRGVYATDKEAGYMADYGGEKVRWGKTAEEWWSFYATRPFLAGGFVWTGFDYRGEPTPYGWPCIGSQFGILDTCGFPKDGAYYYRAWWHDEPSIHLAPHWTWPGREGQAIDVRCFSNCEEVELFLNGKSLGRQAMPRNSHLDWKVAYAPGTLVARGYHGGSEIISTQVETTGAPAKVALIPDRSQLHADGEDVAMVTVAVEDAEGRIVPVAGNEVAFTVSANGRIIGVGNGDPASHESDQAAARHVFNGHAQVILQTTGQSGPLMLTARSPGLAAATLTLDAVPATVRPAVPLAL